MDGHYHPRLIVSRTASGRQWKRVRGQPSLRRRANDESVGVKDVCIAWRRVIAVTVIAVVMAGAGGIASAQLNINIGSLIKLFGIGYVVKQFGPQINDAINTLMLNNQAQNRELTKVVPILSIGVGIGTRGGAYVGAAQVQGPKAALDQVQAVAQIEGAFMSAVRLRGLVPVDSLNPLPGNLHRVYGVGVTALVDFEL